MPDETLGYVSLTNNGGHPGHDAQHAAIRRWIAPQDMTVSIIGRGRACFRSGRWFGIERGFQSRAVQAGKLGRVSRQGRNQSRETLKSKKAIQLTFIASPRTGDGFRFVQLERVACHES